MEVRVTIFPNGDTDIDVIGATGNECREVTKSLENKLGSVSKREVKNNDAGARRKDVVRKQKVHA